MLTSTPWSLLFLKKKLNKDFFFRGQTNPWAFSSPSSKGATTFFKPIYNYHWQ